MNIEFDRELIDRCQKNAPRYTSYPTADHFSSDFNVKNQLLTLKSVFNSGQIIPPISLYIHIPFCNTLCLFCACNKIITNDRSNIAKYLGYLEREMELYYNLIGTKLDVIQLHFGGGSPSWMSTNEINRVMAIVRRYFNLDAAHEVSMEIDPRHTKVEFIQSLKNNGFNRISIGLQDLDKKVQKAVNRIQSFESSSAILESAKELGFKSTNIDLIYGLPFQSVDSFATTIDTVINMNPDRIALFNYAHIPGLFMPQSRISDADLPNSQEKLDILQMCVGKLASAGYVFIGMDHFALPTDELAIALKEGTLQRNFQGYSTFADTNMLAFGVSSIGFMGNSYYQNNKDLNGYYQSLDNGELAVMRGLKLTKDDIIRKYIIQDIMCQFSLDFANIAEIFVLDFNEYFAAELTELKEIALLGLITLTATRFNVTDKGRFLIRNVAMIFDKYLKEPASTKHYSKVI